MSSKFTDLSPGVLAAVIPANAIEYDGEYLYVDDQDGARSTVQKSYPANALAAVAVPASGSTFKNTQKGALQLLITGGVVSLITLTRGGVTADIFVLAAAAAVDGLSVVLLPGDVITCTYTTVPVIYGLPL